MLEDDKIVDFDLPDNTYNNLVAPPTYQDTPDKSDPLNKMRVVLLKFDGGRHVRIRWNLKNPPKKTVYYEADKSDPFKQTKVTAYADGRIEREEGTFT